MAGFIKLDDSPMFQKQISYLEQTTEELKDRCQILHKGCKKYMESLGDACIADSVFADYLEAFGGGQDDPLSVSIGGPIMSKFVTAFREIATFKELLRSQVEHVLVGRLSQFLSVDIQDTKDSRKRLDKAVSSYDQVADCHRDTCLSEIARVKDRTKKSLLAASLLISFIFSRDRDWLLAFGSDTIEAREKFASLKKSARDEVVAELEEDLNNSKSAFERTRFSLVNSLMNIEAKKKHEFLESLSAIMDAHLRYFKLGHDLWSQLEPLIHQVLTYAQQCKEQATIEHDRLAKRIQEFRTEAELKQLRVSSDLGALTTYTNINGVGMSSDKCIEEIMQSTKQGKVQTIKQGYLLKRSSHSKAGWKRRFFILDSRGELYYLRNMTNKSLINQLHSTGSWERDSHMLGKFRSRHYKAASYGEVNLDSHIVDLWTSTIKIDAEDKELRLCFRIISPMKTYTLQAENEVDRIDWMTKITGVIASLLNTHLQQQYPEGSEMHKNIAAVCNGYDISTLDNHGNTSDIKKRNQADSVSSILRRIPGNDRCAECSALDPDWASVNLGILICIECSGIHRNLGVHISKVRSITLDVKVWEPAILDLFRKLGNFYCNSIWEDLLWNSAGGANTILSPKKPSPADAFHEKEKYIVEKYVKKSLVSKGATIPSLATSIWEAVKTNNVREVYRLIVISDAIIINTIYDEVAEVGLSHNFHEHDSSEIINTVKSNDPATCDKMTGYYSKPESCLQGCSLLHLACHSGNTIMLELLLQFGADINWCDYHGRTPLHHCICAGNNHVAKFLLRRGARASIKDGGGFGALERAMEIGAITDEELFVLLAECQ